MSHRLDEIEIHHDVAALAAEWDELADSVGAPPFARPGWFAAWVRAFGGDWRLEVLALRRSAELAAVLPMLARRESLRSPTNWHTPGFPILAVDTEAAERLVAALFRSPHWKVTLSFLDSATARLVGEVARRRGWLVDEELLLETPYVELTGGSASDRMDGKARRVLGRRRRRLQEHGAVTISFHEGVDRLDEVMSVWFRLEASSWKGRQGDDVLSRPETTRFYLDLAEWAAPRGYLLLAFLCVGERPVAFQFGLDDASRWYFLKTGYDEEFSALGPGKLLMADLLDAAQAAGRVRVDLGGSADPYKLEWTGQLQRYVRLQAYARSPRGLAVYVAQRRTRPFVGRLLRRLRRFVSDRLNVP